MYFLENEVPTENFTLNVISPHRYNFNPDPNSSLTLISSSPLFHFTLKSPFSYWYSQSDWVNPDFSTTLILVPSLYSAFLGNFILISAHRLITSTLISSHLYTIFIFVFILLLFISVLNLIGVRRRRSSWSDFFVVCWVNRSELNCRNITKGFIFHLNILSIIGWRWVIGCTSGGNLVNWIILKISMS